MKHLPNIKNLKSLLIYFCVITLSAGAIFGLALPVIYAQTTNNWNIKRNTESNDLDFYLTSSGVGGSSLRLNSNGSTLIRNLYDLNDITFFLDPNESSRLKNLTIVDKLGVGISAPQSPVEIWGGSSPNALVTFGVSGGAGTDKIFRILSDAPNGETLTYTRNGFLGLGTTNPLQKLDVSGNIQANIYYDRTNPGYYSQPSNVSRVNSIDADSITSRGNIISNILVDGNNPGYQIDPGSTNRMNYIDADNLYSRGYLSTQYILDANNSSYQIDPTGRTQLHDVYHDGLLQANSDLRLKTNIKQITDSISKIERLRGVSFDWKQDTDIKDLSNQRQIGMIAQEMEQVLPEIVSISPLGYKGIDYAKLTSVLVEAIKEQQKQIEEQRIRNDAQDKEIQALKQTLEQLRKDNF